jgi:ligand-binding sensor domain-containing protein/signal transduction histidine kinase/DNA-binding response OmpR family regulator
LILSLTSFGNTIVMPQKLSFEHLTVSDGLSNGRISSITQDSTGFIWIGTGDGLNRFDGFKFKIFNHKPSDTTSISSNSVLSILSVGDKIWVGTQKGVDTYDPSDEVFYHMPIYDRPGIRENFSVDCIYKDFKNRIFIGTSKGIYLLNEPKKSFEKFYLPGKGYEMVNFKEVTYIVQDRDKLFWIGTQEMGVFTYDEGKDAVQNIVHYERGVNTLVNNKIFSIYEDNYHIVWIGTNEGLYAVSKKNRKTNRYIYDPKKRNWLPHVTVNKILEDSHNTLWLATNGGLSLFNRKDSTFSNYFHDDFDNTSINNNSVHYVFEDYQRNLWIGSGEDGINLATSKTVEFENFKHFPNKPNSLNYGYVLSVLEDHSDNIWIGTNGGGVNVYESKTQKFKYLKPPATTKSRMIISAILSLMEDDEGRIWMGTYLGGLVVYDPETNKYLTYEFDPNNTNSLSNNVVNHIIQDRKGNIWIATGRGVNVLFKGSAKFKYLQANSNYKSAISDDFCSFLYEDSYENIWIGTYNGLNKYNPVTGVNTIFLHSNKQGSISSDVILSIYEDANHRLWIGTDFGLNLFDITTNSFKAYTVDDGLPNNVINGILDDSRGFLWISTNKGLSKFDPEAQHSVNYGLEDGIASLNFYHGAYFKSPKGILYFGGVDGLTFFNPDKIKHSNYKSPLVFTDFFIYNQSISPKQKSVLKSSILKSNEIVLDYYQSFIAIEYASLNFVNPNKDNYSYFLEGFDRVWNNVQNQRNASYTNLLPGSYTFYVKALNENRIETKSSLKIIVRAPFWRTYYAYAFYLLLFFSLIYFIYSYLHSRTVYKHNLLVERIEKEKAIEINQAKIRFFINVSHDFKTPLTLIISPLEKLISSGNILSHEELNHLYHLIYRNTLRLSRLINQVMDLRKIDTGIVKLHVKQYDIVAVIKEIAVSFEEYAQNHALDYTIDSKLDNLLVWFDLDKIEKVLYNILSNAFRYTSDGKSVKIQIETINNLETVDNRDIQDTEGYAKISVQDQGRGIPEDLQTKIFTRFFQVQTESLANPSSSGIGLSIAREFVEMHRGYITVKSLPKQGSTFSIILPLGNKHFNKDDFAEENKPDYSFSIIDNVNDSAPLKPEGTDMVSPEDNKRKYKILVIDDNYELRNFLFDNLQSKYYVFQASNGKEGLDLIYSNFPDLIISDVMMPVMNGIELCKIIKSDIKISHIPIILLTVLNSINNQIEGYEIGADDYVTKPFNINLLEARIFNLIETRKKIISKFVEEIKPNPKNYSHNLLDEKFMQKALEIVEKNISNFEFSAEDFAEQIGMSRSNLHIKLKALTNQSATEFIRIIRLKKAIQLLSSYQHNISEVSYMVGFNSISYFNRCFKQQFGVTPSDYLNKGLDNGEEQVEKT